MRPPLHPLEKLFLGVVLVHLGFLPWAFGTMHTWAQATSLGLASAGFILALIPRYYDEEHAGGREFRLNPWGRLRRFPPFWLGILLLGYIGLQGSNPSWIREGMGSLWWLRRVNDIPWLPTSIDTPVEHFNLWRQLMIYGATWLTVCALWIGITRRKSLLILAGALAINGGVLAVTGLVHHASGSGKLLWLKAFPEAQSFASFVYRNHAGEYFGLVAFLALGLAGWQFFDGRKRMARSTPAMLWLLLSLLLVFAVVFSLSRGAIISLVLFGGAAGIAQLVLWRTSQSRSTTPVAVNVLLGVVILGVLGFVLGQLDLSKAQARFNTLSELQANDPSLVTRRLAHAAAGDMLGDYWLRGVGAGGFRFLYSNYTQRYPEIHRLKQGDITYPFIWEHAHNDWMEIPIELGLTGVILILASVAWVARRWWRGRVWRHPFAIMMVLGLGQILLQAAMDFPFQNPAILTTWWALLVVTLRWLELDSV